MIRAKKVEMKILARQKRFKKKGLKIVMGRAQMLKKENLRLTNLETPKVNQELIKKSAVPQLQAKMIQEHLRTKNGTDRSTFGILVPLG